MKKRIFLIPLLLISNHMIVGNGGEHLPIMFHNYAEGLNISITIQAADPTEEFEPQQLPAGETTLLNLIKGHTYTFKATKKTGVENPIAVRPDNKITASRQTRFYSLRYNARGGLELLPGRRPPSPSQ